MLNGHGTQHSPAKKLYQFQLLLTLWFIVCSKLSLWHLCFCTHLHNGEEKSSGLTSSLCDLNTLKNGRRRNVGSLVKVTVRSWRRFSPWPDTRSEVHTSVIIALLLYSTCCSLYTAFLCWGLHFISFIPDPFIQIFSGSLRRVSCFVTIHTKYSVLRIKTLKSFLFVTLKFFNFNLKKNKIFQCVYLQNG